MTIKKYLETNELSMNSVVTNVGSDEFGHWVTLDETLFHPQGGGQKSDIGYIDDCKVVHVAHAKESEVLHYIDQSAKLSAGDKVEIIVNEEVRNINSRLHTAGHLISALTCHEFPNLIAISGHHWPNESRVEFSGEIQSCDEILNIISKKLSEAICAGFDIEDITDKDGIRCIKIGPYPPVPCGGTHQTNTSDLDGIMLTKAKAKKGKKLRLSYQLDS